MNMGGLVKFTINNLTKGCKVLVTSESHSLSGKMGVISDENDNKILQAIPLTEGTGSSMIAFAPSVTETKQLFYLPLPIANEIKLNVKVFHVEYTNPLIDKNTIIDISRGKLIIMPTITLPTTADGIVLNAASYKDINNALSYGADEGNKEVVVDVNSKTEESSSAVIEVSEPIVIPTELTTAEGSVKITFDEVPLATGEGNTVVLTDNQQSTESFCDVKFAFYVVIYEICLKL